MKDRTSDIGRWDWRREFLAVEGFVLRQWAFSKRCAAWEVVFLAYTVVNTLTIGLIGAAAGRPDLTLYLIVGGVLWGFLSLLFHEVAASIAFERWDGTLEYTFMAPVTRFTHLAGTCVSAVLYGLVRTLVVLVTVAVFFDLPLSRANFGSAAAVLAVSSLSFMGLGLVAATLPLLSPEKGTQATHIIQALILLVSGVYYETTALPAWLRPVSALSPATYTLRAMRAAILEGAGLGDLLGEVASLVVAAVVLIPLGMRVFTAAETYARRTGLLKRNG